MNALTQFWKSRTNRAALLGALITSIDANYGFISGSVPEKYRPFLLLVWPVAMLYFRSITTQPVSEK